MDLANSIKNIFKKKNKMIPVILIEKESDIKEFESMEEAIAELENDLDLSKDKIRKLTAALQKLKDKSRIKIKNGEIIE